MPPEHDHAMLWPPTAGVPTRRSRDPVIRPPFPPFPPFPQAPLRSRSDLGPVSDPDPTAIGGEHDLGRIWPARSGLALPARPRSGMHARDIDEWASTHHGLITKAASGLSGSAWKRAIRSGRLLAVHPGVARLPGTADTPEQRIAAAVLAASPAGIASHRSATYLWGIPRPATDPVDVIAPRRPALRHLSTVRYHRPTDHLHLIPQRRAGIPCTNILRTMPDLGAVDRHAVSGAVGHVLTLGLGVPSGARGHAHRPFEAGTIGGVTALRAAIDDWSIDSRPADSVLEPAMRRLVSRHRLPPVEFHPIIEGSEVDFRFVGTPVIVECDGWTFHGLRRGPIRTGSNSRSRCCPDRRRLDHPALHVPRIDGLARIRRPPDLGHPRALVAGGATGRRVPPPVFDPGRIESGFRPGPLRIVIPCRFEAGGAVSSS